MMRRPLMRRPPRGHTSHQVLPVLVGLLVGCHAQAPEPARGLLEPGTATALEPAELVAVADLNGDGSQDIVRVRNGVALWWDQQASLGGTPQATVTADTDGDGLDEALIATGMGRADRTAPARLWSISQAGARLLWEQQGVRAQITDLHVIPGAADAPDRIFIAAFTDDRTVTGGFLGADGSLDAQHSAALGLRMLPVDRGLLVGRLYGDKPRSPGDLTLIESNESNESDESGESGESGESDESDESGGSTLVPTLRGVRALAAADLDGDGAQDWIIADGWHYAYGQQADATVRVVPGDGGPARVIARLDDSYTINHLEVASPPDGGRPVILATGSSHVVLLQADPLGWAPVIIADSSETTNAVFRRNAGSLEVLVAGQPSTRVPLQRHAAIFEP